MVGQGVEARAGTTEVIGSWSHPSVFSSNVDRLIFIESGEWNVPRSALSLLGLLVCFQRISPLEMLFQELRIVNSSLCIWTEG